MHPLHIKIDNKLECLLCPHFCKISPGKAGICGVRKNTGESIELVTYGVVSGYSLDPIEKNHCTISFREAIFFQLDLTDVI